MRQIAGPNAGAPFRLAVRRTDINGNGEIEFGDLLAVLNQWGDEATCPDTVQLQCGLMEMN